MTSEEVIEAGHSPEDQDGPAPRALVAQARDLRAGLATVAAAPPARRRAARAAYEAARDDIVYRQLAELPLARTQGDHAGQAPARGHRGCRVPYRRPGGRRGVAGLQQIPGVGPQTATQVIAAARQLSSAMMQRVRLRFDPDARPSAAGQATSRAQSIRGSAPGGLAGPREPRRDGHGARCRPDRVEARGQPPEDVLLRFAQARRSPERSQPA